MYSEKVKELLPIGTIVLLKDAEKRLMICGIRQTDIQASKEYDYIGVFYPEGNVGKELHFLFNHKDIQTILFRGFEDGDRETFIKQLSEFYGETC